MNGGIANRASLCGAAAGDEHLPSALAAGKLPRLLKFRQVVEA
jgi:hypothetical protein